MYKIIILSFLVLTLSGCSNKTLNCVTNDGNNTSAAQIIITFDNDNLIDEINTMTVANVGEILTIEEKALFCEGLTDEVGVTCEVTSEDYVVTVKTSIDAKKADLDLMEVFNFDHTSYNQVKKSLEASGATCS